jgi:hypothetical protein
MRRAAALASLALLGCAAPPSSQRVAHAEGVVRVVGSEPVDVHVLVEPESGDGVRVVGPLRDEIRRLAGAHVTIEGRIDESPSHVASRQIEASSYEILSVNGEPVVVGVVQGKTGGWTVLKTRDGELVYLASAPDSIRTGQTVWVQGPRSLVVQSYGILRH